MQHLGPRSSHETELFIAPFPKTSFGYTMGISSAEPPGARVSRIGTKFQILHSRTRHIVDHGHTTCRGITIWEVRRTHLSKTRALSPYCNASAALGYDVCNVLISHTPFNVRYVIFVRIHLGVLNVKLLSTGLPISEKSVLLLLPPQRAGIRSCQRRTAELSAVYSSVIVFDSALIVPSARPESMKLYLYRNLLRSVD